MATDIGLLVTSIIKRPVAQASRVLKECGVINLSECFIDGTFVIPPRLTFFTGGILYSCTKLLGDRGSITLQRVPAALRARGSYFGSHLRGVAHSFFYPEQLADPLPVDAPQLFIHRHKRPAQEITRKIPRKKTSYLRLVNSKQGVFPFERVRRRVPFR